MITTVLLDLDDTILADDLATEMAFDAVAKHAASRVDIDQTALITAIREESAKIWLTGPFPDWLDGIGTSEIEGLRARFDGEHENWAIMREWGPGFRRQSWVNTLNALGVGDESLASELDELFERERAAANPWCAGGEEALNFLAQHYRLGMVTNGIPDVQRTKIDATGIAPLFDAIVVSGELAIGKPQPEIYAYALEQLGASVDETIMVGDSFKRDVLGSQAFGLRAAWISMARQQPEPGDPWMTITSLAELPQVLGSQ